jgi:hypothetical protein
VSWLRNAPASWGAAFCAAVLFLTLVGGAQATTAADVRQKIEELKTALAAFDGKDSVAADAIALRTQLLDKKVVPSAAAADAFIQIGADIQALLADPAYRKAIGDSKAALVAATASIKELNKLAPDMPDSLVKQRFIELLNGLSELINDGLASRAILAETLRAPAPVPDKPGIDQDVRKARDAFLDAWATITEDYKIHIINSWFGDLDSDWRDGRLCDSRSAVRKLCERLTDCALPSAANKPFDQEQLCGYDPAPLADPRDKGVVIRFTCVRGGTQVWDHLAQYPGTDPETKSAWLDRDIYQAVLRSSAMGLRCPFPFKTAK